MTRRLLNLLTALSLLLCVSVVVLWVRSYSRTHILLWRLTNLDEPADPTWQRLQYDETRMIKFAGGLVQFDRRRTEAIHIMHIGSSSRRPEYRSGIKCYTIPKFGPSALLRPSPTLPDGARVHTFGGFQLCAGSERYWQGGQWEHSVTMPCWFVAIVAGILPAARVRKRLQARRRPPGQCSRCGYDLRATPDRCPECGASSCSSTIPAA